MTFESLILEVLDAPKVLRIIVGTEFPVLGEKNETIYYMIDRSNGGGNPMMDDNGRVMKDLEGHIIFEDPDVFDHWEVSDNIGQCTKIQSHAELIAFYHNIEKFVTEAYVESY